MPDTASEREIPPQMLALTMTAVWHMHSISLVWLTLPTITSGRVSDFRFQPHPHQGIGLQCNERTGISRTHGSSC